MIEWQCPACLEVYDVEEGQQTPAICPDCAGAAKPAPRPSERPSGARQPQPGRRSVPQIPKRDFSGVDRAAGFSQAVAYVSAWLGILAMLVGVAWTFYIWSQATWIEGMTGLPIVGYGILISLNAVFG